MPTPVLLLLIATLLPLLSFTVLVFVGKKLGTPLAGWFGTLMIAISFACSGAAMVSWINGGTEAGVKWGCGQLPYAKMMAWIPVNQGAVNQGIDVQHPQSLEVGIFVDSLTVVMFNMITLVATLVHIFSIGYMRDDKRFPRFFTYLGLFCFSMLGLVLGGTILQLFIFWELVGLCSYLLIGFWYEKKAASNAAIKAFVTNRIGDFGFLIGFGILFYHMGNVTLPDLWVALSRAGTGSAVTLPGGMVFGAGLLTVTGIGLFFGAVGKSAQFPLHVWLPDAMEGPTPVSALIHAATMVAAGVYLVARIFPILTPDAKLFIALIGATTLTMAALIAMVQTDIKRVLAYSTLSQLGYMMLAMGVGSWVGGLFHLITHAFFKALLFLGAGSVIHAAHHEQELPQYGGLIRKIPLTAITFAIAVFAIAGTGISGWGFAGYYSKDMILAHMGAFAKLAEGAGKSKAYWLFFLLPTIMAYLTAFYMTRCWMLTFWGKPRNQHLFDHAHETPVMWLPLAVLAVLSVVGGSKILGISQLLGDAVAEDRALCWTRTDADVFATVWPSEPPADAKGVESEAMSLGHELVEKYVTYAFAIGIGLGIVIYFRGYAVTGLLMKVPPLRWIHTWLYRRMYFDELYLAVFVSFTMGLSVVAGLFDKLIVDGLVNAAGSVVRGLATAAGASDKYIVDGAVNGVAQLSQELGAAVRAPQTGRIRVYVTALMIAITLGLAAAIMVALAK